MVGRKSTADAMVRRDGLRRKTFLAELILGDNNVDAEEVTKPESSPVVLTATEYQELFAYDLTRSI